MAITLVFANGKGGVGKSTLAALLVEYCNHVDLPVGLLDADPNATTQTWAHHCASDGRPVTQANHEILVVDTAGTSGGALNWIRQADRIVCPYRPNFADLDLTASWFSSLHPQIQARFLFVPNQVGQAKEHSLGQADIETLVEKIGHGESLPGLRHRSAIYPDVLKGSPVNFFAQTTKRYRDALEEAEAMCAAILARVGFELVEEKEDTR